MNRILINKIIIWIIIGMLTGNKLSIGQGVGYDISLKVIVTRSDNGVRIPGAKVDLFGPFKGIYTTDSEGEIYVKKRTNHNMDYEYQSISQCYAKGYYPASIYNYGYGSGAAVAIVTFRRNDPHQTINIPLEAKSRFDGTLFSPVLLSPDNNYQGYRGSKIDFRWKTIQEAANYEIQLSRKKDFSSLEFSYMERNVVNQKDHNYKTGALRNGVYFWRVRASDGNKWGEWSESRIFTIR